MARSIHDRGTDRIVLSERDTRRVLALLDSPPPPNEKLRKAARNFIRLTLRYEYRRNT